MTALETIFITGVTGYVGCHLAHAALLGGQQVVALARGASTAAATQRVAEAIRQVNPQHPPALDKLVVIRGDVRDGGDALIHRLRAALPHPIAAVWHCAATFQYQEQERGEIEAININGVRHLLDFVAGVNAASSPGQPAMPPPRYFHVGTAYSCGRDVAVVPESIPENAGNFRSLYEWSKHEGERVVAAAQQAHELDATIFRPAIIVGSPATHVFNHSAYYQVISALFRLRQYRAAQAEGHFDGNLNLRLQGDPETPLNFVPIDFVVDAMRQLAKMPALATPTLKIFNVVNPRPPTVGLVHQVFCQTLDITGLDLVPAAAFDQKPMTRLERALHRNVSFQMPYMTEDIRFDQTQFRRHLPVSQLPDPEIDAPFLLAINRHFFAALAERLADKERDRTNQP